MILADQDPSLAQPSREQIVEFHERGFLVASRICSANEIDRVRRVNYNLYRRFVDDDELDNEGAPWNSPKFDQKLVELRSREPAVFGALYDSAQHSIEAIRLVANPNLVSIAAALMGDQPGNLSYSGTLMRMDCPADGRNALMWHQDQSYYPQNWNADHGIVASVALQDVAHDMGPLRICCGSHRRGLISADIAERDGTQATLQRFVPEEQLNDFEQVEATMQAGDVLFLHMNTIHRSGNNHSSRIRFSAICRFHCMMVDDYIPYRVLPPKLNDYILQQVAGPTAKDPLAR